MTLIAVLLAVTILAGVGYWYRSRLSPTKHSPSHAARAAERFAGVEIRRRGSACKAARALEGQRFLANQSPALPLAGCTNTRCDCSFVKYSDRRTDDDRRWGHEGLTSAVFNTAQRRKRADRRET